MSGQSGPQHRTFHATRIRWQAAVGDAIRRHREALGMSQDKVAKALSMSKSSIDSYEDGTSAPPSFVVYQLAMLFDCTTDAILVDPPEVGEAAE